MKKNLLLLGSTLLVLFTCTASLAVNKKPAVLVGIEGAMPWGYDVVYTTIIKPKATEADSSPKPIIKRRIAGTIKAGAPEEDEITSVASFDLPLTVPLNPITYSSNIPEYIAKIAGAVHPKAGLAAGALSVITNEAMRIAGEKMTEAYGNDELTLNLVEFIPKKYYRIDVQKNTIEPTAEFYTEVLKYQKMLLQYPDVAEAYNRAADIYNPVYRAFEDSGKTDEELEDKLTEIDETIMKPALRARYEIESYLQDTALHRMSIMADFDNKPGTGCNSVGYQGPWGLLVSFYLGAKQTNVFHVPFCARSNDATQQIVARLLPNKIKRNRNFQKGGLKLVSTDDKSATFPVTAGAGGKRNYLSQQSPLLSWFDEIIVDEKANTPDAYMMPFKLQEIRDDYKALADKKNDEFHKKNSKFLDKVIEEYHAGKARAIEEKQKELELRRDKLDTEEKEFLAKATPRDKEALERLKKKNEAKDKTDLLEQEIELEEKQKLFDAAKKAREAQATQGEEEVNKVKNIKEILQRSYNLTFGGGNIFSNFPTASQLDAWNDTLKSTLTAASAYTESDASVTAIASEIAKRITTFNTDIQQTMKAVQADGAANNLDSLPSQNDIRDIKDKIAQIVKVAPNDAKVKLASSLLESTTDTLANLISKVKNDAQRQ